MVKKKAGRWLGILLSAALLFGSVPQLRRSLRRQIRRRSRR